MSKAILTIDDFASVNTPAIVDYLCEKNIPAVLFAIGQGIEEHYEEALYALKKGMLMGNHSYSHPHFSEISLETAVEEIQKTEDILNQLYRDAGVERTYRPFRFPYGDKGGDNYTALQEYLKEQKFDKLVDTQITYPWYIEQGCNKDIDTFWTFDFAEYCIRPGSDFTKESVFERIHDEKAESGDALLKEGNQHIVLLHAHDDTESMLPEYYKIFLDYVMERGVEFVAPTFGRR